MHLKPEEEQQQGGSRGVVKSLSGSFAGRGLGCMMLLGLGLFPPPRFPSIFLPVAASFYAYREALAQGVIP